MKTEEYGNVAHYWKDPYEFRPQRFMEDWPRDAFLPFSGGAPTQPLTRNSILTITNRRSLMHWSSVRIPFTARRLVAYATLTIITYRFSETEATAILAVLLSRYHIEVKEEPQFANETFVQRRERVLEAKAGITST